MNTQGVPTNRTPYTFSFACSDEITDMTPGQLIEVVIPITFTAVKIAVSVRETTGVSVINVIKNGVVVKDITIDNQVYTSAGGLGFSAGDVVKIDTLNLANGTKGMKFYFIGYV